MRNSRDLAIIQMWFSMFVKFSHLLEKSIISFLKLCLTFQKGLNIIEQMSNNKKALVFLVKSYNFFDLFYRSVLEKRS